jgi:hypothetical protein
VSSGIYLGEEVRYHGVGMVERESEKVLRFISTQACVLACTFDGCIWEIRTAGAS